MKKGLVKKILLVLLPIAVLVVFALFDDTVLDIATVIRRINPVWLIVAVLSILVYYILDNIMYLLACRFMKTPQSFKEGLVTTMIGFFYSALTPFSSGGQPLQILQMRRRGIKVGIATSVIMVKFIAWQLAVTLFGVLGFIVVSGDAAANNVTMLIMYTFGFICYLSTVILALLLFLKPDWVHRIGDRILNFLAHRKILKRSHTLRRAKETWLRTINDLKMAVKFVWMHKLGMLLVFLVCILEVIAYMSVIYFIYRGFGYSGYSFFYVLMLQCFLHIAVSFIPLPGASVASEGGFYLVFDALFKGARLPAVILWRLVSYYSALVLGLVAVVYDSVRSGIKPADITSGNMAREALESDDNAQEEEGGSPS